MSPAHSPWARAGLLLVLIAACTPRPLVRLEGATMGSTWSVTAALPATLDAATARSGLQAELDRVVAQMSTWEAGSDISRFNAAPAGTRMTLAADFRAVLAHAMETARASGGAFDPTVLPLVEAWGFGPRGGAHRAPDAATLAAARARVGWSQLALAEGSNQLTQPGGVALDFSAIAPGYASDLLVAWLSARGVRDYLVEVGGEFRASAAKPDGSPWTVGIEQPDRNGLDVLLAVVLRNQALSTSGDYRRYYIDAGKRRSHLIDPRSGAPVTHALASVSVLMPTAMQSDATAKVLSVLGPDAGLAWARAHGVAALFLVRLDDGTFAQRATPGFDAARAAADGGR